LLGRTITFNVAQLLTYDAAKQQAMVLFETNNNVLAAIPASAAAGFAATIASCPAENIKTVVHASTHGSDHAPTPGSSNNASGWVLRQAGGGRMSMAQTIGWMYRQHGLAVFWRGWLPLYVKLGPCRARLLLKNQQCVLRGCGSDQGGRFAMWLLWLHASCVCTPTAAMPLRGSINPRASIHHPSNNTLPHLMALNH
jgi:hypothetical protein